MPISLTSKLESMTSTSPPNLMMGLGSVEKNFANILNNNLFMGLNPLNGSTNGTNPLFSMPMPFADSNSGNSNCVNRDPPRHDSPNGNYSSISALDLVDELCSRYPYEDFSLLRKAVIKREVSLTKLPPKLPCSSPSPSNGSSGSDYITQQTMQIIRQQNEYLQLLHQAGMGMPPFPGEDTNAVSNGSNNGNSQNGKYYPWFHPLAQAAVAAAGLGLTNTTTATTSTTTIRNGKCNGIEKRKSTSSDAGSYNFASPKVPTTLNGSKGKTVAAALAASRETSNSSSPNDLLYGSGIANSNSPGTKPYQNGKKPTPKRKSNGSSRQRTSKQSSMDTISNEGSLGMDLSASSHYSEDASAREKKIGGKVNGYMSNTANLENFVQKMMPSILANNNNHTVKPVETLAKPLVQEPTENGSKMMVLNAFNSDPEVAGDARSVARKFGLNIRVVMKWLREGPSKSMIAPSINHAGDEDNNSGSSESDGLSHILPSNGSNEDIPQQVLTHNNNNNTINNNNNNPKKSSNKRKTSKPNQICDFVADDVGNGPLDMVVPIKKRRVSTPSPTLQ